MSQARRDVLYSPDPPVGLLKAFSSAAYELEAEVVVPYSERPLPGVGEFMLVELSGEDSLVGRVSRFAVAGHLTSLQGDAYLADLAKTADTPPPTIMRQMLRYTMKMNLLGHLRLVNDVAGGPFKFSVGERMFATLGRPVHRPSEAALNYLCNVGLENDPSAAELGHLAYGERVLEHVPVRFSVDRLKGRRSFVFARAGYGKSNLLKYLISQIYSAPPDVGLLILDPEGEYALPDDQGRPGLVNVPQLRDRICYYTNRDVPPQYAFAHKGKATVDFGDFPPQDIVSAFVVQEKQENVFANYLRTMQWDDWRELVALLSERTYLADQQKIAKLMRYQQSQRGGEDVSLQAVKNNLVPPIVRLHHKGAALGRNIISDLARAQIVVVDISLLGSEDALALSQLLLHRVFSHNKRHFTDPTGSALRCLAVIEEAQTVLGDRQLDDRNVFVRWVKEGRKYGLGCVLVTQQPGAIADQIISQGDNFFVMHLLNESDLRTLGRHNGHYSDDILAFIRNEPIRGNCYFWCAPDQPFVLPARVADFASVARVELARPVPAKTVRVPAKQIAERVAKHIKDAISSDSRLWVCPAGAEKEKLVAVSEDYLLKAVVIRLQHDGSPLPPGDKWLREELPRLVSAALSGMSARRGQAALAGSTRTVWVMPGSSIQFSAGKSARPERVDVKGLPGTGA